MKKFLVTCKGEMVIEAESKGEAVKDAMSDDAILSNMEWKVKEVKT